LPSLSHPASVMGAANGLLELFSQYKDLDLALPKNLFISACTGSSASGLILSSLILKEHKFANIEIHVSQVFPGALKYWIWLLLWWTKIKFKLEVKIKLSDIKIYYKHKEVNYGTSNVELTKICEEVKNDFGFDIDPIYGARAFSVVKDFMKSGYDKEQGIVYWHCGFTPDWDLLTKN
jgi:1-aminocyclopropane-1-carboxylate deaminase/D-cysteine desulfhydrase-like pyridoxal-dependent ACC family enzyme